MAAELVREVVVASLPALQHLELWLGDFSYGNDVTPDDLRMLFTAATFPRLRYLGLRNDSAADATASLIAEMGLPATVEVLDMSLGVLSDEGAEALIGWPGLRKLKKLDIHHHFVSPAVVTRLRESGPTVDASDAREPDEYGGEQHRYVAVSE
jgi:hypothetical protein